MTTITLASIDNSVTDELKDNTNITIDQGKRIRAYNRSIDILQSLGNLSTTQRTKTIQYLSGETDYNIDDDLGVSDFKQIYDLRPVGGDEFE